MLSYSQRIKILAVFSALAIIVMVSSLACLSSSLVTSVKASDPKVGVEFLED
jgi:hypothetical protein